jgi:flavin reductase (DIM6/NTAB) family NADH-FMN oxidoreductase RutF
MKLNMEMATIMTFDPENLRSAMQAWSAGVAVVATVYEGQVHGMTVNSFTSISLDPPAITISLQNGSRTYELLIKSRVFGLTILSEGQSQISDRFAGRDTEIIDRFAGLQTKTLISGSPLLLGGLAWLDCRVSETFVSGNSTLFIAQVIDARGFSQEKPLIYHNRKYWGLSALE